MRLADLPRDLQTVVTTIERLGRRSGTAVYLVGGAVRDSLLGRPILDIDLAVEGDATALAREAAANLPLELRTHEAFGTAILLAVGGRRIDLASTRAEEYAAVAALPVVRPASLEADLVRRDFTVNSLALPLAALAADEPVEPIDPSGGRADLQRRLLRVHHPRSFLDDPTRILRGVRFEVRLGLAFEAATEELARAACSAGAFGPLSADRLRAELVLLLAEDCAPGAALRRLEALGALAALGLRSPTVATARLLEGVEAALADWHSRHRGVPVARSETLLAAVVLAEAPADRAAAARRLGLRVGRLASLEALVRAIEPPAIPPHEISATLAPLAPEELVLLIAAGGSRAAGRIHKHVSNQRSLELRIDGSTLLAHGFAPGPGIGQALRATRDARLDGRISAGEELDFALGVLRGQGDEP